MYITPLELSFITKRKTGNEAVHTLFLRLSLGQKTTLISMRHDLDPANWDVRNQRLREKSKDRDHLTAMMNQYRQRVMSIHQEMLIKNIEPKLCVIRQRLTGTREIESVETHFLELSERMLQRKSDMLGKNNSPATIQKFRRCMAHLREFIQTNYEVTDMPFGKINLAFVEDFQVYLHQSGCSHNTAMKYLQTVKSVFHYGRAHGLVHHDPFQQFKISLREVERPYLTADEIDKLMRVPLTNNRLCHIRDMFVFCCFTGLAYIDLRNLKYKNISPENGRYWIRNRRKKTDTRTNIPLLDVPLRMIQANNKAIEECEGDTPVFNVISNQKMNEYLKELAQLCQISKHLTFHIARHTFATTITLSNGIPIESVSAMLGHKKLSTTQHYARLIDKKLEEDMDKISNRLTRYNQQSQ